MKSTSSLTEGGEEMGMTDSQYKGMLLDQLKEWKRVRDMAVKANVEDIQVLAEEQIDIIEKKLEI